MDSAREFVRIPSASIQPPGNAITGLSADYLRGIATLDGRLVLVLDVATVLDTSTISGEAPVGSAAPTGSSESRQQAGSGD